VRGFSIRPSIHNIFVVCVAFLGAIGVAYAQQPEKIFRIGYLDNSTASGSAVRLEAFWQEIRKLGWIEGKNTAIEYRFAEGKNDRLPALAADLVRLKVDLIVVSGTEVALEAKRVTTDIPIVFTSASDPVGARLVASLARPGGNVTGVSGIAGDLNTKKLEILKEVLPKLNQVGFLRPPGGIRGDLQIKQLRPAALALELKLEEIETHPDAKDLERAFHTAKEKQVDAIMTMPTRPFFTERKRIIDLARRYRLPGIYPQKEFVDSGGLMSYGADSSDLFRRAATYVE